MNKNNFQKVERGILAAGIITLLITVLIVIYSLGFISTSLLHASSTDTNIGKSNLEINIKGFEDLGLK